MGCLILEDEYWEKGAFISTDCQATLSLASQKQKEYSIDSLLTVFKGFFCEDVAETYVPQATQQRS